MKSCAPILACLGLFCGMCLASCSPEAVGDKVLSLDGLRVSDTVLIAGYFDDCGEWGGHSEKIRVFRTQEGMVRALYEKDTVNCPDPELFNRRVIERKGADLNPEQQALVVSFTQWMIKKSLEESYYDHAGNTYVVFRPPLEYGGMQVVYNTGTRWPAFEDLKKKLLAID